ncbi:MAG: hypothetical protein AAGA93_16370, partial [Actinomycetota bacterium]
MFLSWRVRTPARPVAIPFLLVGALLAAACSPSGARDDAEPTAEQEPAAGVDGPAAVSNVTAVTGSVSQRVGAGRAVAAASEAGILMVATTRDLHVFDVATTEAEASGEPAASVPAPAGGPVEQLVVSPDASTALVSTAEVTELWRLTSSSGEPTRVGAWDRAPTAVFESSSVAVLVRTDVVELVDVTTGAVAERIEAPAAASFGDLATGAGDGSWLVPVFGEAGHQALWSSAASAPALVDLPLPAELSMGRVVVVPDGDGALIELWSDDLFDGVIARWGPDAGSPWSAPLTSNEVWDADPGGGLLVTDGVLSRSIADDGTERLLPDAAGDGAAVSVHVLADGLAVAVLFDGTRLRLEPGGQRPLDGPTDAQPAVTTMVDHDRTGLVVVDALGRVELLDGSGAVTAGIDRYAGGAINDLDLSTDGGLAVATTTGAVTVLDPADPEAPPLARLDHPEGNVDSVAFSPDGRRLATGVAARRSALAFDDTIALWDLAAATRTGEIGGESEDVPGCSSFTNTLRWSPDGSFVVAVSHDFTVLLLDAATSDVRREFPQHAGPVLDVALSGDGRRLATSSNDSTLRIWDTTSGDLVAEHQAAIGGYRSLAFADDGATVLGADL